MRSPTLISRSRYVEMRLAAYMEHVRKLKAALVHAAPIRETLKSLEEWKTIEASFEKELQCPCQDTSKS